MMFRTFATALALALFAVIATGTDNIYITEDDYEVANKSNEAVEENCGDGFKGEFERSSGRDDLERGTGNDNIILKTLENAASKDDLAETFWEELNYPILLWKGFPLAMAAIMLFLWLICCWSFFSFCSCLRCFKGERATKPCVKYFGIFAVFVLLVGIIISTVLSLRGYEAASNGFDNMLCTSAELLNSTLSGKSSEPKFIGLLPLLEDVEDLDKQLETNSPFLTNVNNEIGETQAINDAVEVATQILKLLKDTLALEQNQFPQKDGVDLLHTCKMCQELPNKLNPAIDILENSAGTALADARSEVENQLSQENREDLQRTLRDNMQPLVDVKKFIRDTFYYFIDTSQPLKQVKDQVNGDVPGLFIAVLVLVIAAFLLMLCGCSSLFMFIKRERTNPADTNELPYSKSIHRCAGLTWCCGFFYTIIAFALGGLLHAAAVPMSGLCLVLDDMNLQMLHDIAPALDLNLRDDNGEMLADIIDQCLVPANSSLDANLLDILFVRENGNKTTMRQKLEKETIDMINSKFDIINERLQNVSSLNLSNNSNVIELRQFLNNPVSATIIPDQVKIDADSRYTALQSGPLAVAYFTSTACSNYSYLDVEVPGIENFVLELEQFGTVQNHATCAKRVACNFGPPQITDHCEAGNNFIELKRQLFTAQYRCDLFTSNTNPFCDPIAMQKQGDSYINDCMINGVMQRQTRQCNLADFVAYVNGFDTRIEKAMQRIDEAVQDFTATINVSMRNLVEVHIAQPIEEIVEGTTCGWMSVYYQSLVDGMCFQGVWGLRNIGVSYIVCAFMVVALTFLMYCLWRRSLDNISQWKKDHIEI